MVARPASTDDAGASGGARLLAELLHDADVEVGGSRPHDIRVYDARAFERILAHGSLAAGESYVDGAWDCDRLDEMIARVLRANIDRRLPNPAQIWTLARARLANAQGPGRAWRVGEAHYDIGDELYDRMLDPRMVYSCAYWSGPPIAGRPPVTDLASAQEAKLDLICRKLGFEPGMRVLDIGCGWGGAARFAAERYGVAVVGVTISRNQAAHARELCRDWPVEILLEDYRSLSRERQGTFDRVFSVGMLEHVGPRNYDAYFERARELLADDGLMLLHTIGSLESHRVTDPWIERYIFPNGVLPSMAQISAAAEGRFVLEDWHGFGPDYDRTLLAWYENFERAWPQLAPQYGERFRRVWRYYLLASAGAFRARRNQLWQFVFSPRGVPGGYRASR